ncbi:NYN domain-containing protein [Kutzneria sp. NPDC051319]|uniref:NYN domain-containing protein n=1 Tax=Kutzneria sp. NPDC051319 TaxID=3155047 RepID=UPI003432E9DC
MARVIAYVDGFNLYYGLRARYRRRYLWLDLERLVQRMRRSDEVVKIKYFTALVLDDDPAVLRQQHYLSALKAHSGEKIDIVLGRYQRSDVVCTQCGHQRVKYEEKETDVNIAASLIADTAKQASDKAFVISADSDLCPAIRTAYQLDPGREVIAAFPPARSSFAIRTLVPATFVISHTMVRNSLLPDTVVDPATGQKFTRPTNWY